jgi:BTB/POZ domain
MPSAKHNFHLKHDAHWHAMSTRFKGMQASSNLVDVTLSCEGRKIAAHKMVLSACSSYFANIFEVCVKFLGIVSLKKPAQKLHSVLALYLQYECRNNFILQQIHIVVSLLQDNPCKHPVIVFRNIFFSDLEALVEFMYTGEVSVSQKNLSSFLSTADTLQVQGLIQESSNILPPFAVNLNLCELSIF